MVNDVLVISKHEWLTISQRIRMLSVLAMSQQSSCDGQSPPPWEWSSLIAVMFTPRSQKRLWEHEEEKIPRRILYPSEVAVCMCVSVCVCLFVCACVWVKGPCTPGCSHPIKDQTNSLCCDYYRFVGWLMWIHTHTANDQDDDARGTDSHEEHGPRYSTNSCFNTAKLGLQVDPKSAFARRMHQTNA